MSLALFGRDNDPRFVISIIVEIYHYTSSYFWMHWGYFQSLKLRRVMAYITLIYFSTIL